MYTKPNGLAPQVGDNDNGRILVLHDYVGQEYRDHRHILAVGACRLDGPCLTTDVSDQSADTIWLLGRPAPGRDSLRSAWPVAGLYPHNGYAVAKTAEASLIVRCGPINAMSGGGHNHCDQLSFECQDCGEDLIVDPGAMVYSADAAARNAYRSTAAHNVVQLDDRQQQAFDPRDLFAMQDRCQAAVDLWKTDAEGVCFRGHHLGYAELGWRVEREIAWDLAQARLQVTDVVAPTRSKPSGEVFCGRLHLAAGVTAVERSPTALDLRTSRHRWRLCFSGDLTIALVPGHVSPSYGIEFPATIVEYRFPALGVRNACLTIERATP